MKRFIPAFFFLFISATLMAQTTVPAEVNTAFGTQFPGNTASWTENDGIYTATFTDAQGHSCVANYDAAGTLVRSETQISRTELTPAVETELSSRFLGSGSPYAYSSAAKVSDASGDYEVVSMTMTNGNIRIYFNASGTMVKRELY